MTVLQILGEAISMNITTLLRTRTTYNVFFFFQSLEKRIYSKRLELSVAAVHSSSAEILIYQVCVIFLLNVAVITINCKSVCMAINKLFDMHSFLHKYLEIHMCSHIISLLACFVLISVIS